MNFALFYDLMFKNLDYNIFLITFHKYLKTTNKIVDLGCGTGSFLSILLNNDYNAYGIDNDLEMLELAKRKINKENILFHADITKDFNFKADVFFMLFDVINFIEDTRIAFKNIYNNLNDNGLLIFDFYKAKTIKKYKKFFEEGENYSWSIKIIDNKIIHNLNFYNDTKEIIQYYHNKKTIINNLKSVGFKCKFIKGPDKRKHYLHCLK